MKFVGLFLFISFLGLLSATPSAFGQFTEYKHPENGFSIKYPSTWFATDKIQQDGDSTVFLFTTPDLEKGVPYLAVNHYKHFFLNDNFNEKDFFKYEDKDFQSQCNSRSFDFDGFICSNFHVGDTSHIDNPNYTIYDEWFSWDLQYPDGTILNVFRINFSIPDGTDLWVASTEVSLLDDKNFELVKSSMSSFKLLENHESNSNQESILDLTLGEYIYYTKNGLMYRVASGSMIPALMIGDVIIIEKTPFYKVKIGDIVTFNRPSGHDKVIVHRVASIIDDEPKTIKTKGDANPASIPGTDFPITQNEYIGKVVKILSATEIKQPQKPSSSDSTKKSSMTKLQNNEYGFSIDYPSDWFAYDIPIKNNGSTTLAFLTPDIKYASTNMNVIFNENDYNFQNLTDEQYLEKMAKINRDWCTSTSLNNDGIKCSNFYLLPLSKTIVSDGSKSYFISYTWVMEWPDGSAFNVMSVDVRMPDKKNTWQISLSTDAQNSEYMDEILKSIESFRLLHLPTKQKQESSTNLNSPHTKTKDNLYENQQYGFSIEYPKGWKIIIDEFIGKSSFAVPFDNLDVDYIKFATGEEKQKFDKYPYDIEPSISLWLYQNDTPNDGNSDQKFLDNIIKEERISYKGFSLLDSQITSIAGMKAFEISYSHTKPEGSTFITIIPDGNNLWSITGEIPGGSAKRTQYEQTISDSFKSFRLSNHPDIKEKLEKVPSWIKNNAKWWSDGQIGDGEFISGIQFLIKEGTINISSDVASNQKPDGNIPLWVRNNAKWWSEDKISEDDFVSGIEFLVTQGIIQVQ